MIKKSVKNNILLLLIAITVLLVLATAPAMASYNIEMTSTWSGDPATPQPIEVYTNKKVSFNIDATRESESAEYIYIINLEHIGTYNVTDPKSGFDILSYTDSKVYPDNIISVDLSKDKKTLTYKIKNPTLMKIDVVVGATVSSVYRGEPVKITGNLTYADSGSSAASDVICYAVATFPAMSASTVVSLSNPTILPIGGADLDFQYIVNTNTKMSQLYSAGLVFNTTNLTLDFSDVKITTSAGTDVLYGSYLDKNTAPIKFSNLDENNQRKYTISKLVWNSRFNFKAVTTANFENGVGVPQLDFTGLKASGTVKINNRGPDEPILLTSGTGIVFTSPASVFDGESTVNTNVTLARSVNHGSSKYVLPDSANATNYTNQKYQELFRSYVKSNVRDGTDSVEITYGIPNDVTITHIRLPVSGNVYTNYGEIIYVSPANNEYNLGNKGVNIDFVNQKIVYHNNTLLRSIDAVDIPQKGDDITLKINNALLILNSSGDTVSYSSTYAIAFVGTTHSATDSITFSVKTNESATISSLPLGVSPEYYNSAMLQDRSAYAVNKDNVQLSSVKEKEVFYYRLLVRTPYYPAASTHRTNPFDGVNSGVYSNHAFYFSLPEGLIVSGDPEIINSNGGILELKDIKGNKIQAKTGTILNNIDFVAADPGNFSDDAYKNGSLVEVYFVNAENDPTFWVNSAFQIRLPVAFEEAPANGSVKLSSKSVVISTYDPKAVGVYTATSGGTNTNIPAYDSSKLKATTKAAVQQRYSDTQSISVVTPGGFNTFSATATKTGNLSYSSSDPTSYPELKAGSSNEKFILTFKNDLTADLYGNVSFILPKGVDGWQPKLNGAKLTENATGAAPGSYKVQYTKSPINANNIGKTSVYNVSSLTGAMFVWKDATVDGLGNVELQAGDSWADVTAVRYNFEHTDGIKRLDLELPFSLPSVNGAAVNYGKTARGQTLYSLGDGNTVLMTSDDTYTAAVKLKKSDVPVVSSFDGNEVPTPISLSQEVTYKTGTIPEWWNFAVYDDQTKSKLNSFKIQFESYVTGEIETVLDLDESALSSLASDYEPKIFVNPGYDIDLNFAKGKKYDLLSKKGVVKTDVPGVYTFTYVTAQDDDGQSTTFSHTIKMVKPNTEVSLTGDPNVAVKWKTDLGVDVADYFKDYITITDSANDDDKDKSRLILNNPSVFNVNKPDIYTLDYSYTDIGRNKHDLPLKVAVYYAGNVTGSVSGNGIPLSAFDMTITGDIQNSPLTVQTANDGSFEKEILALTSKPTKAEYTIEWSSVPSGLKTKAFEAGYGSDTLPNPQTNVVFEPVSITVDIDYGSLPTDAVKNVILYESGNLGSGDEKSPVGTSVSFAKDAGQGWYDAGTYFLKAQLEPGYKITAGTDFSKPGLPVLSPETVDFEVKNADLTKNLKLEKAPLIAGTVWNDANKDGIKDLTETGISSATVSLLAANGIDVLEFTATDSNGEYYFVDIPADTDYFVQITVPNGFTHASAFTGTDDQKIDSSNNYKSAVAHPAAVGELHIIDIDAGFYSESGKGGNGYGQATVKDSTSSGGSTVIDGGETQPGFTDPIQPGSPAPEPKTYPWILPVFIVLIIAGVVIVVVIKKYKR
ncbi:hypothetical protein LJC08_04700 [Methanimicrococcus sp. OttesenSCG-928-J09]|nr:hypothetical protein [Methanimicrococcus sp. OttesenSCG-928-J09]